MTLREKDQTTEAEKNEKIHLPRTIYNVELEPRLIKDPEKRQTMLSSFQRSNLIK